MLLSTAYLPPIEYIAICAKQQNISIEAHEHFVKQTYRNRARIMSANGILDLIIPVIQPQGSKTNIKDVGISYADNWNKQHWNAIVSAYNSSPFFEFYADEFSQFYHKKYTFLWDLNMDILHSILKIIGNKIPITESTSFKPISSNSIEDMRYSISPKIKTIKNTFTTYSQVFDNKYSFAQNLSIIDLLCNVGPDARNYILQQKIV